MRRKVRPDVRRSFVMIRTEEKAAISHQIQKLHLLESTRHDLRNIDDSSSFRSLLLSARAASGVTFRDVWEAFPF